MFHSITLCLDMKGCPNRCKHCWMGWSPNGDMPEEELSAAAADFAPFAGNLELYDWDREPDYSDRYRERWELCCKLSGPRPHQPHFELASVWRLVRDGSYAPWLAGLGVGAVQLTLFGGEETTDWYTGRKGAYREILQAIDILLQNGIAPRIQVFVSKRNLSELPQVEALIEQLDLDRRCRDIGREFDCFVHQGSCDGENRRFYDVWITPEDLEKIPPRLAAGTLKYFSAETLPDVFGRPEDELYRELLADGSTFRYVSDDPVFFIDRSCDVYPNITTPSPFWRLGNWKKDGAGAVLEAYAASRSPAQHARLTVPASQLARACGDPNSRRLFGREDYIELLLHRYCAGA
ncbi:MAG: radical SAM protein [Oscillospiraceae bacterium]|nr:radical SAM protein [Oscillospiraceae bacterium]